MGAMHKLAARFFGLTALILILSPGFAGADTPVNLGVVTWIGYGPIYCAAA